LDRGNGLTAAVDVRAGCPDPTPHAALARRVRHVEWRRETVAIPREDRVFGRRHNFTAPARRDVDEIFSLGREDVGYAGRAEVAAAVAGQDLVADLHGLDRLHRPVTHRD